MWLWTVASVIIGICWVPNATAKPAGNITDCYRRYGNFDIEEYLPYNRVWRVSTEYQCVSICAKDNKCKSVIYEIEQNLCKQYDSKGDIPPAFLIASYKKVYYELKSTACLGGIDQTNTNRAEQPQQPPSTPRPRLPAPPVQKNRQATATREKAPPPRTTTTEKRRVAESTTPRPVAEIAKAKKSLEKTETNAAPVLKMQEWSQWSSCILFEGNLYRMRFRFCEDGGLSCLGEKLQMKPCK